MRDSTQGVQWPMPLQQSVQARHSETRCRAGRPALRRKPVPEAAPPSPTAGPSLPAVDSVRNLVLCMVAGTEIHTEPLLQGSRGGALVGFCRRAGGKPGRGWGGTMTQPAREPAPRECRARLGPGASLRHTCSLSPWKVSELGTEPRSDSKLCILSILTCFSPAGQALPPRTSHTSAGLSVVPDGAGRLEGPSEPGELAVSMFSKSESLLALSGRS